MLNIVLIITTQTHHLPIMKSVWGWLSILHFIKFQTRQEKKRSFRVLKAVETYTDLYQVDIIIHTNELKDQPPLLTRVGYNCTLPYEEDQWQCPIVTVLQHNIQQLPHPHYLTWMHRPAMIEQMNSTKYNLYAYIEDDQIISRQNILYHQTYSKIVLLALFVL